MASAVSGDLAAIYVDGKLFNATEKGGSYLKFGYDSSTTSNAGLRQITFDANKINAIYGNSFTVQSPAVSLVPQIRY